MILTFSEDQFVKRIKNGTKIHTIRKDETHRWKSGRQVHFWKGNPRNVKNKPYMFGKGVCEQVLPVTLNFIDDSFILGHTLFCERKVLNSFSKLDGFDNWEKMKDWFRKEGYTEKFQGKLIYFTYAPE